MINSILTFLGLAVVVTIVEIILWGISYNIGREIDNGEGLAPAAIMAIIHGIIALIYIFFWIM